jgi:ABC-type lipoprotein release transport system permease subunit
MLWPVGCGLALGLPVAAAAANAARTLLFGVVPGDPRLYLLSAALVTGVASLAAWLPAWRASATCPLSALRRE